MNETSTKRGIWNRGFSALMVIQFSGAMNDNLLRGTISLGVATGGIWAATAIGAYGGTATVGLCLTIPFLLFSGWGGQIADRYSKRTMTIWLKIVEMGIALCCLLGFLLGSPIVCLACLFLLASQSAFFGPVKYGVIAELVDRKRVGTANGWISMSTQIAIVLGTQLAGFVVDWYAPGGISYGMIWLPGVLLFLFAIFGLAPAFLMPRLKPAHPGLSLHLNPIAPYVSAIRKMAKGPLLGIAFAYSGFWLVGMIALLALPDLQGRLSDTPFTLALAPTASSVPGIMLITGVDPVRATAILSTLGIASGLGSVTCGLLSRKRIHPVHVPLGAGGMTLFFTLFAVAGVFDFTPATLFWVWVVLAAGAGYSAGFYLIPLMTLIQVRAPDGERGRFLGTNNALGFAFMTFASIVYLVWNKVLDLEAADAFFLCAFLAAIGCVIFVIRRRRLALWVTES